MRPVSSRNTEEDGELSPRLFQCVMFHFTIAFKICGLDISVIIRLYFAFIKEGPNRFDLIMKHF